MTSANTVQTRIFQAVARCFHNMADDIRFSTMSRYPWTIIPEGDSLPVLKGSIYVADRAAFDIVKARLAETLENLHIGINDGRVDFTAFHVDARQERAMVMALVDNGFYAGNIAQGCRGPIAGDGHYCITATGVNPGLDAHYTPHNDRAAHTRHGDLQPR